MSILWENRQVRWAVRKVEIWAIHIINHNTAVFKQQQGFWKLYLNNMILRSGDEPSTGLQRKAKRRIREVKGGFCRCHRGIQSFVRNTLPIYKKYKHKCTSVNYCSLKLVFKNFDWCFSLRRRILVQLWEGGIRVCSDAVLLDFWCGFAEIFTLSCGIAVLQNQAQFAVFLYVILCGVFMYFWAVLRCSYPPYAPLLKMGLYSPMGLWLFLKSHIATVASKEIWDISKNGISFYKHKRFTVSQQNILNRAVIVQRTQQGPGPSNTIIRQLQVRPGILQKSLPLILKVISQ